MIEANLRKIFRAKIFLGRLVFFARRGGEEDGVGRGVGFLRPGIRTFGRRKIKISKNVFIEAQSV